MKRSFEKIIKLDVSKFQEMFFFFSFFFYELMAAIKDYNCMLFQPSSPLESMNSMWLPGIFKQIIKYGLQQLCLLTHPTNIQRLLTHVPRGLQ